MTLLLSSFPSSSSFPCHSCQYNFPSERLLHSHYQHFHHHVVNAPVHQERCHIFSPALKQPAIVGSCGAGTKPHQERMCRHFHQPGGCKLQGTCKFIHAQKCSSFDPTTRSGCPYGDQCRFHHYVPKIAMKKIPPPTPTVTVTALGVRSTSTLPDSLTSKSVDNRFTQSSLFNSPSVAATYTSIGSTGGFVSPRPTYVPSAPAHHLSFILDLTSSPCTNATSSTASVRTQLPTWCDSSRLYYSALKSPSFYDGMW